MKVGYMANPTLEEEQRLREYKVDYIVCRCSTMSELEGFRAFLNEYQEDELVFVGLTSIGETLTLIQLLDDLLWLEAQGKVVSFIEQGLHTLREKTAFQRLLIQLASFDKRAIGIRTKKGLQQANEGGRFGGRPTISEATIQRINELTVTQKMTISQIADQCQVSIGTVWKYRQLAGKE